MAFRLADNWLFGNRRWLNPRIPEELGILVRRYGEICRAFPMFERCSRQRYIHIITNICSSWCGGIVPKVRRQISQGARTQAAAGLLDDHDDDAIPTSIVGTVRN